MPSSHDTSLGSDSGLCPVGFWGIKAEVPGPCPHFTQIKRAVPCTSSQVNQYYKLERNKEEDDGKIIETY